MDNSRINNEFFIQVQPALASKLLEFRLLGMDSVTEKELWEFLQRKKWRKVKNEMRLYAIIQDILSVKASDYITYAAIETYKQAEFSFDNEADLKELLK